MDVDQPASSSSSSPASTRVFAVAELATMILEHLEHDRVDLIACACVSKMLRVIALSLLVRKLSISHTNVQNVRTFLRRNTALLPHIKAIRIWDEHASRLIRARSHARTDSKTTTADSVLHKQLKALLSLFKSPHLDATPPLDITVALDDLFFWDASAQANLLQNTAAIRALVLPESPPTDVDVEDPEAWEDFIIDAGAKWSGLLEMLQLIRSETDTLRLLHIEDYLEGEAMSWYASNGLWDDIRDALSTRLTELAVRLSADEEQPSGECTLLSANWPHLRKLHLVAEETALMDWNTIQARLDDFLHRHSHLEEIRIQAQTFLDPAPLPHFFPRLRRCAIDKTSPVHLAPFLARHHATIKDLTIPALSAEEDADILFPPDAEAVPALDVFRGPKPAAAALIARGCTTIKHLEFDEVRADSDLALAKWLIPHRQACESITCFDIELTGQLARYVVSHLDTTLPPDAFPNLVELALCCKLDANLPVVSQTEALAMLTMALARLADFKHLRALRLEDQLNPLLLATSPPTRRTSSAHIVLEEIAHESELPPALEYISWVVPTLNRTEYYRLLRSPRPRFEIDDDFPSSSPTSTSPPTSTTQPFQPRSGLQVALQRLPPSFAVPVDKDGVWDVPSRLRDENTLFDHSVSPPRRK